METLLTTVGGLGGIGGSADDDGARAVLVGGGRLGELDCAVLGIGDAELGRDGSVDNLVGLVVGAVGLAEGITLLGEGSLQGELGVADLACVCVCVCAGRRG